MNGLTLKSTFTAHCVKSDYKSFRNPQIHGSLVLIQLYAKYGNQLLQKSYALCLLQPFSVYCLLLLNRQWENIDACIPPVI